MVVSLERGLSLSPYYYRVRAVGLEGRKSAASAEAWIIAGYKPPKK